MTTILDMLRRAASDPAFGSRFAHDPLEAARAVGLQTRGRGDARYLEARLAALARPLDAEQGPKQLEEAAADMRAGLGLERTAAAREAARALFFLRDYRFHQRLLSSAGPSELTALIERFRTQGPLPGHHRGTLLITLHYGPFPLLWLWLKHAESRGVLSPFTLLYDTRSYRPDLTQRSTDDSRQREVCHLRGATSTWPRSASARQSATRSCGYGQAKPCSCSRTPSRFPAGSGPSSAALANSRSPIPAAPYGSPKPPTRRCRAP